MVMGYPGHEPKHARKDNPVPNPTVPPMSPATPAESVEPPTKDKNMFDKILGANWKAIIGFGVTFGSQLLARAFVDGTAVLPTDLAGWGALIGGSLLAAGLIWVKGNNETVDQLQRKLDKKAASKG